MAQKYLEEAFTPNVLEMQRHYYGQAPRLPKTDPNERTPLTPHEVAFIGERDSFYLATISETGWPYVQHRGGPIGFLRVLDSHTLGFADFHGNRQLLSTGNLTANDRVALFLMDYPGRTRLKIIGHARVLDADEESGLLKELLPDRELLAKTERVFVIEVVSFDWNCPQYITPRYTEEEVERIIAAPLKARIRELEAELSRGSEPDISEGSER